LGIAIDEDGRIRILAPAAEASPSGGRVATAASGRTSEGPSHARAYEQTLTALPPADLEALDALSLPRGVYRIEPIP
jgi:hypothetical protein